MLSEIFDHFGLSEREAETYLRLLETGPVSVGELARGVQAPRSSLYGYLKNLNQHGLVAVTERDDGVQVWQAEDPASLKKLVTREVNKWQSLKSNLEQILPLLISKQSTLALKPKFTYFEGLDGVKQVLLDMLSYPGADTQAFWPIVDMLEILGDRFLADHNVARIKQGISIQAIWPQDRVVNINHKKFLGVGRSFLREIRRAPPGIDCSMGYWAYHNKVAFLSSRRECFAFLVESIELRQLLKTQFDLIWNMSEVILVDPSDTLEFLERYKLKNVD